MRELDLLHHAQLAPAPERDGSGGPLADAVHGEHRGALERRRVVRARRVAEMVLGEQQPLVPVDAALDGFQLLQERAALEQLVLHPHRQRGAERREAARRKGEIGLEQPLELEERLVVERDIVDLRGTRAGRLEARANRVVWEARVMLLAREALFLRRRGHLPVDQQRRGRVVVIGRDAEDFHQNKV